jgi:hypothetical protein
MMVRGLIEEQMGQLQNISSGGQGWIIGFMSFVLGIGLIFSAVWVLPQNMGGNPVGQMASSKGHAVSDGLKLQPAVTSGILLIYSFEPWGGAVFHATQPPCHRKSGGQIAVQTCGSLTGSSGMREICLHDSQRKISGKSHLTIRGPLCLNIHEVNTHLHRT